MSIMDFIALGFVFILALYGCYKLVTDRSDTEKEAAIMWVIEHDSERGVYAIDICSVTGVSGAAVYPILSRLERRGLVRRSNDSFNNRVRYHFITAEARKQLGAFEASQHREDG